MKLKILFAAFMLSFVPLVAAAQHDHHGKGPNGGEIADVAGHRHLEFVPSGAAITLFLSDSKDQPIATKGVTGRLIIQDGGKNLTLDLAPEAPNKLVAKLPAPLGAGAKVVVTANLPGGEPALQARFVKQ